MTESVFRTKHRQETYFPTSEPKGCLREEEWKLVCEFLEAETCSAGYSSSRSSFNIVMALELKVKVKGAYVLLIRALRSRAGCESQLCHLIAV